MRRRRQTTDIPLTTMHITVKRVVKKCMFRRIFKLQAHIRTILRQNKCCDDSWYQSFCWEINFSACQYVLLRCRHFISLSAATSSPYEYFLLLTLFQPVTHSCIVQSYYMLSIIYSFNQRSHSTADWQLNEFCSKYLLLEIPVPRFSLSVCSLSVFFLCVLFVISTLKFSLYLLYNVSFTYYVPVFIRDLIFFTPFITSFLYSASSSPFLSF